MVISPTPPPEARGQFYEHILSGRLCFQTNLKLESIFSYYLFSLLLIRNECVSGKGPDYREKNQNRFFNINLTFSTGMCQHDYTYLMILSRLTFLPVFLIPSNSTDVIQQQTPESSLILFVLPLNISVANLDRSYISDIPLVSPPFLLQELPTWSLFLMIISLPALFANNF